MPYTLKGGENLWSLIAVVCDFTVRKEVHERKVKVTTVKILSIKILYVHNVKLSYEEVIESRISVGFDKSSSYCKWTKNLVLFF